MPIWFWWKIFLKKTMEGYEKSYAFEDLYDFHFCIHIF